MAQEQKIEFGVSGMGCAGCSGKVQRALNGATGVISAEVSHEDANAIVVFDPDATTSANVISIVNVTGYETSLVSAGNGS